MKDVIENYENFENFKKITFKIFLDSTFQKGGLIHEII